MATSQYSYLRQYAPYVSPYNVDLIKDVMLYKQEKVDANRQEMYNQIDYLMGQELAKTEDREYLRSRMSDAIARINRDFDGMDLSSDGVVRAIQSEISSVLDDKVINGIAGTKEYQRLVRDIESIRTKNPELYSAMNEQDAMMPYINWLNDGQAGTRLGSLHYVPYYNYQEEITKNIKDFRELNKGRKIQLPIYDSDGNQTGALMEINQDLMSYSQIRNFVAGNLNPRAMEQIGIEARYMARMNPLYQNPEAFQQYANSFLERYNAEMNQIRSKLKSVGDNPEMKSLYESQLQEAKTSLAMQRKQVNDIMGAYNPEAAAGFIINNNLMNGMADVWSYDNTSFERKKDEFWFAYRKDAREELESNEKIAEMQLNNERLQIENEYLRQHPELAFRRSDSDSGGSGSSGSRSPGSGSAEEVEDLTGFGTDVHSVDGGAVMGNRNLRRELMTSFKTDKDNYKKSILLLSRYLSTEEKKEILANYGVNTDELYNGLTDEQISEAVYDWLNKNNGEQSAYLVGKNKDKAINVFRSAQGAQIGRYANSEALTLMGDELEASVDDFRDVVEETMNNLSERGLMTGSDEIDKRLYHYSGIASLGLGTVEYVYSGDALLDRRRSVFKNNGLDIDSINMNLLVKKIADIYGENIDMDKYFDTYTKNENTKYILKEINVLDSDPKTIELIKRAFHGNKSKEYINDAREMMEYVVENQDRVLADSTFSKSFKRFPFSSNTTGRRKDQFNTVLEHYFSKVGAINQANGKGGYNEDDVRNTTIMEIVTMQKPGEDKIARYLVRNGDIETAVEINDTDLRGMGIDPSVLENRIRTRNYETEAKDIIFEDPTTETGQRRHQTLTDPVFGYGLSGIAYKSEAKSFLNVIAADPNIYAEDGIQMMETTVNDLVELGDKLSVKLEGSVNDGIENLVISFVDREHKNDPDVEPIVQHVIAIGPYADLYDSQYKNFNQKFYVDFLAYAINYRNEMLRSVIKNGNLSNGVIEGSDYITKLLEFKQMKEENRNGGNNGN